MVSYPELGLDPLSGSVRELGCDTSYSGYFTPKGHVMV